MQQKLTFSWKKKGRIYDPGIEHGFIKSHAQMPTALYLNDEKKIRIYFSTRSIGNISQATFIDVDIKDPSKILYVHDKPVIEIGKDGMFDEHGIMPTVVLKKDNTIYLYYTGWSLRVNIPYSNWGGLAISKDNGITFKKISLAPILDRTAYDLFSAGASTIIIENNVWRMLYVSGIDWVKVNGKYEQTYSVKYASSLDGITWNREKHIIIPQTHPLEAITRPTVAKIFGKYHMWFCYRGCNDFRDGLESYKIGYAWSNDYLNWHREDEKAGILPSSEGWDSRMLAYPKVIEVMGKYLMFYNGNGFGKSGFGYAELEF